MDRLERAPRAIVATMMALVVIAIANLSGVGIGSGPLLYDTIALPRLVVAAVLTTLGWSAWFFVARDRGWRLRYDVVWVLLACLGLIGVVSAALSPHRALALLGQSERLEGAVTVVLYALVYGLALQALHAIRDVRLIAIVLGIATMAVSGFGLLQYAGLDPTNYAVENYGFEIRRAFATFGNPNFLAGLLVLVLPLVVAIALTPTGAFQRIAFAGGSVLIVAVLYFTFTRGAWLAAIVEAIIAGWIVMRRGGARARRIALLAFAVLAVLAISATALSPSSSGELDPVARITELATPGGSANERLLGAEIAWQAAVARPLIGYGPDSFLPAFRMHRSDRYVEVFGAQSTLNNAHNWPLQYAATLGFPGALLLVAALALALWRSAGSVKHLSPEASAGHVLMAAVWIGCLGFTVHMLFNVAVLGSTLPFVVLLAALGRPRARELSVTARSCGWLGAAATLACVSAIAVSIALVSADAYYFASRDVFAGNREGDALALASKARALNPSSVKYARGAAEVARSRAYAAIEARAATETVRALSREAEEQFAWVLRQSPNDYPGLAWFAGLQASVGVYESDDRFTQAARSSAMQAARLDRQHAEVAGLARGDFSRASIRAASNVARLP